MLPEGFLFHQFDKFTEWWTSLGLVKASVEYQTRNLLLIFTPHFITFFWKKIPKHLYFNILKMSIKTFPPPWCFRRWTGPPIHANQNNHTMTKIIVLGLCFVTVLCHIVNRSYMLYTVQHSYMIKVFLSINEDKNQTVLKYSIKHSCV